MFSTKEQLQKRTGEYGVGREEYLTLLVKEFHITEVEAYKKQVLANLANFAYDPINFEFLLKLKVIDIFLDNLSASDDKLQEYAVVGLNNISVVPEHKDYILHQSGVQHLLPLLSSNNEEVVLNSIATLYFLLTTPSNTNIDNPEVIQEMKRLSQSSNIRISKLAQVFLHQPQTQ